ncbi:MAG: glutaminyl-tRNA synthase (glutamine-hydrolyzing) subunit B [Candidatus Zambryskibacteria bacterium RIFCSPHIGHO2_01_FULL_49_18]|uniref:Aspartyl/glutamyl-tRNA(Asn/Gln) amidotransferase subunit B n=1 Tax=Candidatus Zambryskibacteria bacterium RIFCSPHIGHO2_01_FULL_49_18 TaxID=1802740 RepID=A0A1G2T623_9BACT|nr:MAG: glutaminyl-tRNA synthase (glutamine-hydrolyzing) subunit B [Candidatus Zambryskibacteria bacterium RIFCSPHIGHO2_01_FULL_49_18]
MYRPTIGLEIHAELKTRTKMFCNSANDPDETRPNVNVCPVCMAHPGTLPVINREAVRHILRIGTAVGGTLADFTEFDRKSYFYPDIPKGYQISQYIHPLVTGGSLAGVDITRVHLEEDTARSTHSHDKSLVDFNRAGIPLMELVTEPVIKSAEEAGAFARELQLLLRTFGTSEANLEKGEMRIEANVSVAKHKAPSTKSQTNPKMGTKVEIKNLNSFRSVERAIEYEIKRQTTLIEEGGKVVQETRGWNEAKQETFHQRFKEGSADYRYFPEPDLPKLYLAEISEFSLETLRASLPELPQKRRARYQGDLKIKVSDSVTITESLEGAAFFDKVIPELTSPDQAKIAANFLISDLASEPGSVSPEFFAKLVRMFAEKTLSSRGAKDVLAIMKAEGGDPERIAKERGLIQSHDAEIFRSAVKGVLVEETKAVEEYRAGKEAVLQYLIGKSMKAAKGAGNPAMLKKLITEELGK